MTRADYSRWSAHSCERVQWYCNSQWLSHCAALRVDTSLSVLSECISVQHDTKLLPYAKLATNTDDPWYNSWVYRAPPNKQRLRCNSDHSATSDVHHKTVRKKQQIDVSRTDSVSKREGTTDIGHRNLDYTSWFECIILTLSIKFVTHLNRSWQSITISLL